MQNIVTDLHPECQPLEVQSEQHNLELSGKEVLDIISPVLYSRDAKDLLILEYILEASIAKNGSVKVEDLMTYMKMSNPAISTRVKKLREYEINIKGIDIPLLKAIKSGNAFVYSFADAINHNTALSVVQNFMVAKGLSYQGYLSNKSELGEKHEQAANSNRDFSGDVEENQLEENKDFSNQINTEAQNTEELYQNLTDDNQIIEEVNFEKVSSRKVTMGEVLEMLDETSDTLIENITEALTEVFNEEITKLNNRITELEKKLSSSQELTNNEESADELLVRARLLVRQKIFAKKVK